MMRGQNGIDACCSEPHLVRPSSHGRLGVPWTSVAHVHGGRTMDGEGKNALSLEAPDGGVEGE